MLVCEWQPHFKTRAFESGHYLTVSYEHYGDCEEILAVEETCRITSWCGTAFCLYSQLKTQVAGDILCSLTYVNGRENKN